MSGDNDDTDCGGVLEANRRMLTEQTRTDIHFIVKYADEKEKSIGCHQYVLCSRSRVFETMVYGALPVSEAEKEGICIDDIPFDIFYLFLQFVYYEHLDLTPHNIIPLLYAAKKYMVKSLETHCSAYLRSLTKTENACLILDQSLLYDQKELVKTSRKLIQMNTFEALGSETFLWIREDALCDLLNIPSLSCSEKEIFQACVRWAEFQLLQSQEAKSSKRMRELLKEPLKLIHFGGFTPTEIVDTVEKAAFLPSTEVERLLSCISAQSLDPEGEFNTSCRARYHGNPIRFVFKCAYGMMQRQAFKSMYVTLRPNLPVQLKTILLDLKDYTRSDFALSIKTGEQIYRHEVETESGDFMITLSREVRVEAGAEFKMELFVRSSLPITVTVQSEVNAVTEIKHLDSTLEMNVMEASRGAGAVFKAIDVLPLAL